MLNAGLNFSVLDGWRDEAYDGTNCFALGRGETHSDVETHDRMVMDDVTGCTIPAVSGTSSDMSRI